MGISQSKAIGSLIGLAIGDALGAPYEFKLPPYEISKNYSSGGIFNVSCGEWTDDTSMALCLAQSLIDKNGFDPINQMDKYLAWRNTGYMCTRERCFDIGITIDTALLYYSKNKESYCGLEGDQHSGNGSLMRLAPIAIFYRHTPTDLIKYSALSSQTTHKSQLAVDSCIFYGQLIAGALNGIAKDELLSKDFIDTSKLRSEVVIIAKGSYKEEKIFHSEGFVLYTMETALMAFFKYSNFEDGLLDIITRGNDVDTIGAVYGQLAGAYYGYEAIPKRWRDGLVQHTMIYEIAQTLAKGFTK